MIRSHPLQPPVAVHVFFLLESLLAAGILAPLQRPLPREFQPAGPVLLRHLGVATAAAPAATATADGAMDAALDAAPSGGEEATNTPASGGIRASADSGKAQIQAQGMSKSRILNRRYLRTITNLAARTRPPEQPEPRAKAPPTNKRKFGLAS